VVEYGGGISHGPAGQVSGGGGGGGADLGQPDVFASISHTANDLIHQITSLPPEVLAIGIVVFFVGLIVLKRAF
jgi:hypothetical protein